MPIFTNSTGVTFVDNTTVTQVAVTRLRSAIRIVSFTGLTHTFPDDLGFLSWPGRTHNLLLWSDVGSTRRHGAAFTIADSGAAPLPTRGNW